MIWKVLRYWLLLAAISIPLGVTAQVRPEPLPPDDSLLVQRPLEFLADSGGQWTLDDVRQRVSLFRIADSQRRLLGIGRPTQWLRVRVVNRSGQPISLMASLDYPYLDQAQFYVLSDSGQVVARSGPLDWTVPISQRPVVYRNPAFPFTLLPRQSRWVYTQIAGTSGPLIVELRIQKARTFSLHDRQERLFWGWTLGVLCWLVVISGLLGVLVKESTYGYYSLYMLTAMAYLMAATGIWFEWFPARQYGFVSARHLPVQLTAVTVFTAFLFIRHYVLVSVWHHHWVRRIYYASLIPAGFNVLFISFELPFADLYKQHTNWISPIFSSFYLIPILMMYGLVIWQSFGERHNKQTNIWQSPAQLYLLSLAPLVGHTLCRVLNIYELLPRYTIPGFEGIAVGYLLEFMFLSVGLGFRYKRITDERQQFMQISLRQQLQLQLEQNRSLQAQLRLQQEKERIARDLHDHVGVQLSVIASSLDHVRLSQNLNGTASQLEAIGNHARDAIGFLRETIWAINREHLPVAEFAIQLQQYLARQQQVLPDGRVELRTYFNDLTHPLTSEQALNLFRIVQEAVGNALHHAHAETISVTVRTDDTNTLHLEVKDDGVGFDLNAEHPGHYGLLNMQLRAERLGGVWQVSSETGRGTTLSVVMLLQTTSVVQSD